jgi:hypothetical protein
MKKRFLVVLSLSLIATLIFVGTVSAAPAQKVSVCHFDETAGKWHLITISGNAVPAHMRNHSDGYPLGAIPGKAGWSFLADCSLPLDVTGTWTGYSGYDNPPLNHFTMVLSQAPDGTVTGTFVYDLYGVFAFSAGNVTGTTLQFTITQGSDSATFTGTVSGGNHYVGGGSNSTGTFYIVADR